MNKLIPMILLSLTACQPIDDTVSDTDDVIEVNDIYWSSYGNVEPYPFTTQYGHIACSLDEVTYYPDDTINDESLVGLPLNKLAQKRQDDSNVEPTVKNVIKPNADLSEAIRMGLERCKQVKQRLNALRL